MDYIAILKTLGYIIVILTFIKAVYEYVMGLKWKRSELLLNEIKEFLADDDVKLVLSLLDWNSRKIKIDDKVVKINDAFLVEALKTHNVKSQFTTDEARIRDLFDSFFDKLSSFNILIKNGLVDSDQVVNYLSYYLDIISIPGRKPKALVLTFNKYIDYYGFDNMKELIQINDMSKLKPTILGRLKRYIF